MIPYILIGILLIALVVMSIRYRFRLDAVISDYEDAFPGRCGTCAFHEFGIREGKHPRGSVPEDHRCKEGYERFRGALH